MTAPGLYGRVADLEVEIDTMRRYTMELTTTTMDRVSTVVVLSGGGIEGRGEDVSYDAADQAGHMAMAPLPLTGTKTLAEWSALLDETDLVPEPLVHPESFEYRRWCYEGALLDLALRQAGLSLERALGRTAAPVRFCVSPSGDPQWFHDQFPDAELKVNAFVGWPVSAMEQLAATGMVRVVDLKAHYAGDWVKRPDDPLAFSREVAAAFPDAILEDPAVGQYMAPFNAEHTERISFDAPVHKVADLQGLPPARWCNIKPSRFGSLRRLLECVDHCEAAGIGMYGGGQFELGPGRAQVQALASVLYPDAPNDVAPSAYNAVQPGANLPTSPLPATTGVGFAAAI